MSVFNEQSVPNPGLFDHVWYSQSELTFVFPYLYVLHSKQPYRIVSNKRPGGVAIFQKGDVYKRQVYNAKMQCLSLLTMTSRREI